LAWLDHLKYEKAMKLNINCDVRFLGFQNFVAIWTSFSFQKTSFDAVYAKDVAA
jgi:hypothetical protein